MATITSSVTKQATPSGATMRYLFEYTLDNGEVHQRRAWVPIATNEVTERTARGTAMLTELAEAEAQRIIET